MTIDRRAFLTVAAGCTTGLSGAAAPRFDAVAFDAFTLFDPRPVAAAVEEAYPGRGKALADLWRDRQFEYTWLRTLSGAYVDFEQVTRSALIYAARAFGLELTADRREQLMQPFRRLTMWPDSRDALVRMKRSGLRLALLSNLPEAWLRAGMAAGGLDDLMERPLSTDRVRAFKPDPRAYRMAEQTMGAQRDRILFAAFAGWDAAGAKQYGLPTFWVNRMGAPAEELGVSADASGRGLDGLADFAVGGR